MSTRCFRDIENADDREQASSALGEWYESVRAKPIATFSVDDLCRCCRQELHLRYIIPAVISALEKDPLAGHQYDGELASAVCRIRDEEWTEFCMAVPVIADLLFQAFDAFDADIQSEIEKFLAKSET